MKGFWVYTTDRNEYEAIMRVLVMLGYMWEGSTDLVKREKVMDGFMPRYHHYILMQPNKRTKIIASSNNRETRKDEAFLKQFEGKRMLVFNEFVLEIAKSKIYIHTIDWGYLIFDGRENIDKAMGELVRIACAGAISIEDFRRQYEKQPLAGYPVGVPIDRVQDGGEERLAIAFNGGKQALYYSEIHGGIYEVIYGGSSGGHLEANRVKVLMLKGVYSDLEPGDIFFDGEVSDEKSLNDESNYNVMINDDEYVCVGTKGRDIWTINVSKETREGEIYKVVEVA